MENNVPIIVAIDDNKDNLVVLQAFVKDAFFGAMIFTATNGKTGIELALEKNPDVILLDILMPGMNGFEVCIELKKDPRLSHIPVVFLTALKDDKKSRIRALEAGGDGFITKPFEEAELVAQIRAMAKIKAANVQDRREKQDLTVLVAQRTALLERELAEHKKTGQELVEVNRTLEQNKTALLNLLEDLNREIGARKLIEETLVRVNQKLNVLSDLTRRDLTSQIFVLKSYLEIAKKQAAGQDHIIDSLLKIDRTVRSINDITEISKDYQDMGAKPPAWQNVNMMLLFGLSHISIGKIQHSLEIETLEIFADPLLEKAFQGLFENTVAHGEHVSYIRIWYEVTPESVVLIFENDGVGIPHERKERIFLRGEGVRTSVRGLFFVREILDITGITIKETGEPGKGARFEMTVPKGAWRITGDSA